MTIGTSPAQDSSDCDFFVSSEARYHRERSGHAQVREDASTNGALADSVRQMLQTTGYLPLRNVDIKIESRAVWLGGAVSSYYLKQLAQAVVMRVPGVGCVVNDIEVVGGR